MVSLKIRLKLDLQGTEAWAPGFPVGTTQPVLRDFPSPVLRRLLQAHSHEV